MYEGFDLKKALNFLDKALPCGNNPICRRDGPGMDPCFNCPLFDLKEYWAELRGDEVIGKPYGDIDELKDEFAELQEKTRWRSVEIDGWPEDGEVAEFILCTAPPELFAAKVCGSYRPSLREALPSGESLYWRPFDLPEEAGE